MVFSFCFVSFLVLLAVSDLKWKLLPHPFNNFFILTGLIISFGNSGYSLSALFANAGGFVFVGSLLYGITQIIPKGLGGGDIKMGAGLVIWLNIPASFLTLLLAFGMGTLVLLPLLVVKKVSRKSSIPFGPFLAVSALINWFCPHLTSWMGMAL